MQYCIILNKLSRMWTHRCTPGVLVHPLYHLYQIAGISALRVSPCGQFLTSGDNQGNIRVYDIVLCGEVIRNIEAHDSQVLSLDFSGSRPGTVFRTT